MQEEQIDETILEAQPAPEASSVAKNETQEAAASEQQSPAPAAAPAAPEPTEPAAPKSDITQAQNPAAPKQQVQKKPAVAKKPAAEGKPVPKQRVSAEKQPAEAGKPAAGAKPASKALAKTPRTKALAKPVAKNTARPVSKNVVKPEAQATTAKAPTKPAAVKSAVAKIVAQVKSASQAELASLAEPEAPMQSEQTVGKPAETPATPAKPVASEPVAPEQQPAVPAQQPEEPAATIPAAAVAKHFASTAKNVASSAKHLATNDKLSGAKDKLHVAVSNIPAHNALKKAWVAIKAFFARLRVLPKPVWIALGVVLGVYLVGCIWFSSHFLPGTTVNGTDASGMSKGAFVALVDDIGKSYELDVTGNGVDITLTAKDIDLKYDSKTYAESAFDQNHAWTWPVGMFLQHSISANEGVSYSKNALSAYINNAVEQVNAGATTPHNALLIYDESKSSFVAEKPTEGTAVDAKAALAKVEKGIKSLEKKVELGKGELVQASVQLDDTRINAAIVQANKRANLTIDLKLGDQVVATIDENQVRQWVTLSDDCEVVGDVAAIEVYTRGELSKALDTVGTMRSYTRPDDGKQVQVYGGTYGWSIDGSKLATKIASRITKNSDKPIKIPTLSEGYTWVQGGQDWGPGYIDVDLTEQIVRMYDNSGALVLLTYCVTGDQATNNGTITGVYSIQEKSSPKKLIGLDSNGDGQPDYENDVQYWMSFFGGYGLHDALWRDLFGGSVFQAAGSHGCVNLPYSQAQLMYNSVTVGYPVVVHL